MAASSEMAMISSQKRSLVHPFHDYSLTLRDLSKDCKAVCVLCKHYSQGPTYCCEECDFILHEVCAEIELPPLIQGHPSHRPDHLLNLVSGERSYCCSGCGFSLGALTAIATRLPPQDVEEETIRHFRHEEHPLSSFCVETALQVQCGLCQEQICAGQVYGCRSCLFLLHEACARLTLEIQHTLHPRHPLTFVALCNERCKVCISHKMSEEPGYSCEECRFALHIRCAVLTMDVRNHLTKDAEEGPSSSAIDHISHRHPLTPLHVKELVQSCSRKERLCMECKICRLDISGADAFACGDCSFFLHRSCADKLPDEIQHPLHPQHPCLVLRPKDSFQCNCCHKRASDIAFTCEGCEFNLDSVCAFQMLTAIEDGVAVNISHFVHEHPLTLAFTNAYIWDHGAQNRYKRCKCRACHQFIDGVAYRCITCNDLWLHRSCVELPLKLEHAFHPQHPLVLSEAPSLHFFCFACDKKHKGLAFHCAECEFYLGVQCASVNQPLKHPRHEHCLGYYERNTTKQQCQCNCCGKRSRYDFYWCMRCNFSLHRDCLHLPPTLHHKSHWHPLQLRDKFVDKDPNDLYCDYCETIRHQDHGIYHCEECQFSAHIECIASDYKEGVKQSKITWGSDRYNQLDIEISSGKAKVGIIRRDLETMRANIKVFVEKRADIENEEKENEDKDEHEDENEESKDENGPESEVAYYESESDDYQKVIYLYNDTDDENEEDDGEHKEKKQHGLKHPCHKHQLFLRILSEKCHVGCNLCELEIHGPAYCCEGCDYFLHGSCALIELPPKIDHPCHPSHQLRLSGDTYGCRRCRLFPMVLIVIATLPPHCDKWLHEEDEHNKEDNEELDKEKQEEMGVIRHFAHKEHPLTSFHIEIQLSAKCRGCRNRISGNVYGCRACFFLLHTSCARSPPVIDHHPFGYGFTLAQFDPDCGGYDSTCGACAKFIKCGFVYRGLDDLGRWFQLHMACALSTRFPPNHQDTNSVKFKGHPCPLVFFHIEEETYAPIRCRACELKISGEALGCPRCCFFLHKSCLEKLLAVEMIHHFLHPDHPNLILQARGESMSNFLEYRCRCTACKASTSQPYRNPGMAFQCDNCEFYLNPNCALQTLSGVEEGVAASISHFAHDHLLLLHFTRERSSNWCIACDQYIDGLAYCCLTCDSIRLHKSCAELPQELQHPFHPQHLLVLLSKPPSGYFHCDACHEKHTGFAYFCGDCGFFMDMRCASLNLTLKHPRHEHKLAYFEKSMKTNGLPCNACGKACKKDLYHCVPCNFSLHHDCLPLLHEITHEGHMLHPLFLRDKFVEGDPNYQYCDHCEELRNPDHGVYRCEECWFSGHIDCMISMDKVEVEEKETEVESKGTEAVQLKEMKTIDKPVANQLNPKVDCITERIDVLRSNIGKAFLNLEVSKEELEELEMERAGL